MSGYIKLVLILTLASLSLAQKAATSSVDSLLKAISSGSPKLNSLESEEKSKIISKEKDHLIFNSKSYISGSYMRQKNSEDLEGFSPSISKEYELGTEKLWKSGIKSNLSYSLSENLFESSASSALGSASSSGRSVFRPQLELKLSSYIVQDLFYGRYQHAYKSASYSMSSIKESYKTLYRNELTKGLIDFLSYLESKDELLFQEKICNDVKKQLKVIRAKKRRGSVSNRDYYIAQKDEVSCELTSDSLRKRILEIESELKTNYGLDLNLFKDISITLVYNDIQSYYKNLETRASGKSVKSSEVRALELTVLSEKSRLKELKAKSKNDILLEVGAGLQSDRVVLSRAHDEIKDLEHPYLSVGLRMGLPWSNKSLKNDYQSSIFALKSAETQLDLEKKKLAERVETLSKTIEADFIIYEKHLKSVSLSERILKASKKDYNNGRLSFMNLSDFNKSLIDAQRNLASFRAEHIARSIEYFDYYNFFDKYYLEAL